MLNVDIGAVVTTGQLTYLYLSTSGKISSVINSYNGTYEATNSVKVSKVAEYLGSGTLFG